MQTVMQRTEERGCLESLTCSSGLDGANEVMSTPSCLPNHMPPPPQPYKEPAPGSVLTFISNAAASPPVYGRLRTNVQSPASLEAGIKNISIEFEVTPGR